MESPTPRTSSRTPGTCTVPGLLVGLTRLCKLTKVCAAPTLDDEAKPRLGSTCGGYDQRLILIRLFEAMGSLKSAYVKLQKAHFPYDPAKIAFADEIITSELDSVTALQSLCSSSSCGIGSLVNERWSLVQELEAEARKRDSDIVMLKKVLERLQRENSRLNRQIKSGKPSSSVKLPDDNGFAVPKELAMATPSALLETFKMASASVHDFAEMMSSLLLISSSEGCVGDADAAEQSWRRYSLEAHLWRTMLGASADNNEEKEGRDVGLDGIMRLCDPMDALMQYPRSSFSRFCRSRYLAAVPSEAEAAMFGKKLEQRALVSCGGHPRTWFYRAFATMARLAWALRVLIMTGDGVRMFYARRGSDYAEEWMAPADASRVSREGQHCVAFTVTPGVKVGDTVVPCRVLLRSRHHPK